MMNKVTIGNISSANPRPLLRRISELFRFPQNSSARGSRRDRQMSFHNLLQLSSHTHKFAIRAQDISLIK